MGLWQYAVSPRRQVSQVPSSPPKNPTPTRWPTFQVVTLRPTSSMRPIASWPGTLGYTTPGSCPSTVPASAVFLQTPANGLVQLERYVGVDPHQRHWRALQNGVEDKRRCVTPKREQPGRHLLQHRANENRSVRESSSFRRTCSGD